MYHLISLWKIQLQVEKVAVKVCEPNWIIYKFDLKLEFIVCKYLGHGRPQYYRCTTPPSFFSANTGDFTTLSESDWHQLCRE
jgi:hypothetical protein